MRGKKGVRAKPLRSRKERDRLINENLGLINLMVHRLWRQRDRYCFISPADLWQEGALGLIRAAELYNPDRGLAFSTYACHAIRHRILEKLGQGVIRIPRNAMEAKAKPELKEFMRRALRLRFREERELHQVVGHGSMHEDVEEQEIVRRLREAMDSLDRQTQRILYLRYWGGLTIREIAQQTRPRITREGVRQKIARTLVRIREMLAQVQIWEA